MNKESWVASETGLADFGDLRLNKRYTKLLTSLANAPDKSIPASCSGWAETCAAYRFFNHKKVSTSQILEPHIKATINRMKEEPVVLIPQDTTDIDFSERKSISDIGYLASETRRGFYLHPSIAITPDKCCLGIVDSQFWIREQIGIKHDRDNKPIEKKETYCWIKGYNAANKVAHSLPNTVVVSICDREGDLYELLEKQPSDINKAYWLVRARHNRKINSDYDCLMEKVKSLTPIDNIKFTVPESYVQRNSHLRHKRSGRKVIQDLRLCCVEIPRPAHNRFVQLNMVKVYAVHCIERNPPAGEKPIEWLLLTSYPVTKDSVKEIVNWYLCRWQIEVYFKILKSGCRVEALQFGTYESTRNCVALYMIVAWRILYITIIARHYPESECSLIFDENEWQAVYAIGKNKRPPKKPPKLEEMINMIAGLGGYLGRKGDDPPGPKIMWIGMQRVRDYAIAWKAFKRLSNGTYV